MAARRRGRVGAPPESGATVGWSCADAEVVPTATIDGPACLSQAAPTRPVPPSPACAPCRPRRLRTGNARAGCIRASRDHSARRSPAGIRCRCRVGRTRNSWGRSAALLCSGRVTCGNRDARREVRRRPPPDLRSGARSGAAEEEMSARRNSATGSAGPRAPAGACFAVKRTLAARRTATLRPWRYPFGTNELRIPETAKGAREEAQEGREEAEETGTNPLVTRDRQRRERHPARAFGLMRSARARSTQARGRGVASFATGTDALPAWRWKPSHPSTPVPRRPACGRRATAVAGQRVTGRRRAPVADCAFSNPHPKV